MTGPDHPDQHTGSTTDRATHVGMGIETSHDPSAAVEIEHDWNGLARPWLEKAHSQKGGLAILFGNLAPKGSVIKSAGVAPSMMKFKGPAVIFESPMTVNAVPSDRNASLIASGMTK